MSEQDVGSVSAKWRAVALLAIVGLGMALVAVVFTAMRKQDTARITQQYGEGAALVNTGAIIDATDPAMRVTPQVGYRYRVFVEDESDDRASGIARIGGRTTFIDGARRGQTCVVDVTRVQDRVVNASLVHVVAEEAIRIVKNILTRWRRSMMLTVELLEFLRKSSEIQRILMGLYVS